MDDDADDGVVTSDDDGPGTTAVDDTRGDDEGDGTTAGEDGDTTRGDDGETTAGDDDTGGTTGGPPSCQRIEDEKTCDATDGCTFIGGACVQTGLGDCDGIPAEPLCNLTSGCMWDGNMCVEE